MYFNVGTSTHERASSLKLHQAECALCHVSGRLRPCERFQSGQLEAKPASHLSVLCVERYRRNQKTKGKEQTETNKTNSRVSSR